MKKPIILLIIICLTKTIFAQDATNIYQNTVNSTVTIETDIGLGSGFFISKNVIVTNYHVIKNASEQIKLLAVQKDGECIRYLLDPSEELQLAAVNQNKLAICFIKNPTQKVIDSARIIVKEGE